MQVARFLQDEEGAAKLGNRFWRLLQCHRTWALCLYGICWVPAATCLLVCHWPFAQLLPLYIPVELCYSGHFFVSAAYLLCCFAGPAKSQVAGRFTALMSHGLYGRCLTFAHEWLAVPQHKKGEVLAQFYALLACAHLLDARAVLRAARHLREWMVWPMHMQLFTAKAFQNENASVAAALLQQHPAMSNGDLSHALAALHEDVPPCWHETAAIMTFNTLLPGWRTATADMPRLIAACNGLARKADAMFPAHTFGSAHTTKCASTLQSTCGALGVTLMLRSAAATAMAVHVLQQCQVVRLYCTVQAPARRQLLLRALGASGSNATEVQAFASSMQRVELQRQLLTLHLAVQVLARMDSAQCQQPISELTRLTQLRRLRVTCQRQACSTAVRLLPPMASVCAHRAHATLLLPVARALPSLRRLRHLALDSCGMSALGAYTLAKALQKLPELQALIISNERISVRCARYLSFGLASLAQLQGLAFTRCTLPIEAADCLGMACTGLSRLHTLDISYTKCHFCLSAFLPTIQLQRKDLTAIGRLLLVLGCCSTAPTMDALAATYSEGLVRAVSALLASVQGTSFSSWQQVSPACTCAWAAGMHVIVNSY